VSDITDEELLAAHLRGDRSAFGQLVARHERRVYGICLRMLGNREDAQDAAQEAFLAALRRASTFRQAAAFSTWLYRIAVNAATDQARRRVRARTTPLDPEDSGLPPETAGGGDPGDTVATAVAVQSALTRIPEDFRAAVVLCDLLRLPYSEAAKILEVPVGTLKSRVFRGRLALGDELGELGRAAPARLQAVPGTHAPVPVPAVPMPGPVRPIPGAVPPAPGPGQPPTAPQAPVPGPPAPPLPPAPPTPAPPRPLGPGPAPPLVPGPGPLPPAAGPTGTGALARASEPVDRERRTNQE
jgi:RNA polymerase sigma-70 factor (ECF subfamily)